MIRIVTKSTLDKLQAEASALDERCIELVENNKKLNMKMEELQDHLSKSQRDVQDIKEENDRLMELTSNSDKNEVVLRISEDLTLITPVVRWRGDETSEKLIELGMLKDSNNTKMATQVALMAVALEGLEQIIEEFQPSIQEE